MAAAPLRRLGKALGAVAAGIALAVGLFVLASWIGSSIPRNGDWREPGDGITIMVETNGLHTSVVMPLVSDIKDWRTTFPAAARFTPTGPVTHIAVGWGEREVFLDTPTWADLNPLAALRILTTGGDSVLRVSPYVRPAPGPYHRPLRISPDQYERLVRRVEASLAPPRSDGTRAILADTYSQDLYYEAVGRYTTTRTCNSWVGDTLAAAGVRMGWWTPFAGGVMKWIEEPGAS